MLLAGKVALVTGGGRGLGREHALALAAAGAKVVVNDLGGSQKGEGSDASPAESVVAQIRAAGGEARADARSVGDWRSAHAIVADTIVAYGDIDILVNNAGINRVGVFGSLPEEDWELSAAVNIKGTVATMNAAAAHWQKQGSNRHRAIINTASPALHPVPGIGIYSATKAAVASVTQVAAQELAALGVKVNAIAPMARTRMIDDAPPEMIAVMAPRAGFDRFLPEHVAQLVLYLASPLCRFTGRVFGIGGDDVFLFDEWSAEHHASNHGVKWTPESLQNAMADFPAQQLRWTLYPGGRVQASFPADETLTAVQARGTESKA